MFPKVLLTVAFAAIAGVATAKPIEARDIDLGGRPVGGPNAKATLKVAPIR
jgi:hypothetical protein